MTSIGYALGRTDGASIVSHRDTTASPANTVCQQPPRDPARPVARAAVTCCSQPTVRTWQITAGYATVNVLAGHARFACGGPAQEMPLYESARQHNCQQPRAGPTVGCLSGRQVPPAHLTAHTGRGPGRWG